MAFCSTVYMPLNGIRQHATLSDRPLAHTSSWPRRTTAADLFSGTQTSIREEADLIYNTSMGGQRYFHLGHKDEK